MRHWIAPLAVLACVVSTAQAQLPDTVSKEFESYISSAEELAPVLKSVQDAKSADAAVEPMRKAMISVYNAHNGLKNIPNLTAEQTLVVREQYEQRMRQQWGLVYEQIFRLNKTNCYDSPTFSKLFHIMCMMLDQ